MDPKANVQEQVEIARRILHLLDSGNSGSIEADADRLAELVLALDNWRKSGGADPYTRP